MVASGAASKWAQLEFKIRKINKQQQKKRQWIETITGLYFEIEYLFVAELALGHINGIGYQK